MAAVSQSKLRFEFEPLPASPTPTPASSVSLDFPRFTDVAAECALDFTYLNGASTKALMVEATGGGCGWLDFDRDGLWDLFLPQGGVPDAARPGTRPPDQLFRNRNGRSFVAVEQPARIDERQYGQAVAVGDFNDDGFDDLYITNVGRNTLLLNLGDGTFFDVTASAAVESPVWSTSAAWADLDADGDLDLYVCNYTIYDPYDPVPCLGKDGTPAICHPRNVEAEPDHCYENLGDGRFREVSAPWGLTGPGNKALGVVVADFTDDGAPDVYVANDTTANFLFVNQGHRQFRESAMTLGCAFSATGQTQASMGAGFGDYDRNGLPDLYLTHFTGEHNTLYANLGRQGFQDVSAVTGMRSLTLPKLGFGTLMADFNADGYCDVIVANGHIDPQSKDGDGYEQRPQLLSFDGARWRDGSEESSPYFAGRYVGRGVASADFDNDGDCDVVIVHQNSRAALLRNESQGAHWVNLEFLGRSSNRRGVGVLAKVRFGDSELVQQLAAGTSYAAAHQPRLAFGLGDWHGPCQVEVAWPSGEVSEFELPATEVTVRVAEGGGPLPISALPPQLAGP